ncbi:MAG: dephospho-CoA kinase [Clostridia bacterium]|nr:dephospho-CoA kinase [Clostridia bacterium]
MYVLGLTGGIACGKSTVSRQIRHMGIPVIDGDELSHRLTDRGGKALDPIREAFGDGMLLPEGGLDRKKMGRLVFSDDASMEKLNAIMHPLLRTSIEEELASLQAAGTPVCLMDMPLLFEQHLEGLCQEVWCVALPEHVQIERLCQRDHLTEAEAIARIRTQMPLTEKIRRAQRVIDNSGSESRTMSDVQDMCAALLTRLESGQAPTRHRRADRYRQSADVSNPSPAPAAPASNPQDPELPIERQVPRIRDISESRSEQHEDDRVYRPTPPALPQGLIWSLFLTFLLALALLASQFFMDAFLHGRRDERQAAYEMTLRNHPMRYEELVDHYAALYNLQPAFVNAIILNESSFDYHAESGVGARGLMQLMSSTAEWIAGKLQVRDYTFDMMWDPERNIEFGCWYLNYLSGLFSGDPVCVISAYHAGQGTVAGWLSDPAISSDGRTLSVTSLPEGPTRTYAGRVTLAYAIYDALYFHALNPEPDADSLFSSAHLAGQ